MKSEFNKPLVTHMYTADPSVHVFDGKLYIYPSHDLENDGVDDGKGDHFKMVDYHVFSMEDIGAPLVDHGQALHVDDVPWAVKRMWDCDAAYKNGKYYLYFPAHDKDGIFRIGVATSDKPMGPFKAEPDFIPGSYSIDPAVFADGGKTYMYFGGLWGGQLEHWRTGEYVPFDGENGENGPQGDEPAMGPRYVELSDDMLSFKHEPKEILILDENGAPIKAGDTDRRFFEASCVYKYTNGKYYLIYSTGDTHFIAYAESDSPTGPFTYKGRVLEPVSGWTNHAYITEFKGKWYLFYHDCELSNGNTPLRNLKYTELEISPDGTIATVNPYKK